MEEILYELRDHSAGLNCGRWDYIFSFIKTFRQHADFVLPDRGLVGMTQPFMAAYTARVVHVCHKRGVHAMGGMAAQIPIKSDPDANEVAINKVRADKLREVQQGHDGTWVAHPGLVAVAKDIFDEHMPTPNQIDRQTELQQSAEDLMAVPTGTITEQGVYTNVNIGLQYLEAWLRGNGCVPLYFLMEDAATAEISRAQLWQWIRHGAKTESGRVVTQEWVLETLDSVVAELKAQRGDEAWADSRFEDAAELLAKLLDPTFFHEFLTLPAYELLAD